MPNSTGISALTGKPLSDWDHVQQSIRTILTTPIGSRVMRRDFGSELRELIDGKLTRKSILSIYSAAASAINRWEPRYRMRTGRVTSATSSGRLSIEIFGTYFPLGHLGNYSVAEDKVTRIVFEQ